MSDLAVESVGKEFVGRGAPLTVLRDVSLRVPSGSNLAIVGPSGSGKSTLLHILGTLDRPTSGRVRLGDVDPFGLDDKQLAEFRNKQIGFVFQDHHLLPQLSVLENVLIPALATGAPSAEVVARAKELLTRVGLQERLTHRPAELSGGERQRVGVARALVLRPSLLLADEPTGNLDRTSASAVADALLDLQRTERTTLIVVTHSQDLAGRMESRYEIDDGRLRPIG